jgi:hypothetical protein
VRERQRLPRVQRRVALRHAVAARRGGYDPTRASRRIASPGARLVVSRHGCHALPPYFRAFASLQGG